MGCHYDVEKLASGNRDEWEKLVKNSKVRLQASVVYYRISKNEADDIIQKFWGEFWARRETIPEIKCIEAYISSAIKYKVISHIRGKKRRLKFHDIGNSEYFLATNKFDGYSVAIQKDFMSSLRDFAKNLTPRQKEVFFIILAEPQLTFMEIGRQLNCSKTNVFKIVKRIRRKFEEKYDYKELKNAFSKIN